MHLMREFNYFTDIYSGKETLGFAWPGGWPETSRDTVSDTVI